MDLLFIDIDDNFVYHQTVASANQLFLIYLYRLFGKEYTCKSLCTTRKVFLEILKSPSLRIRKRYTGTVLKLLSLGIRLHLTNLYRNIVNRFLSKDSLISCKSMIYRWAGTITCLGIRPEDYRIKKKHIEPYRKIMKTYRKIRRKNPNIKVIALTESFIIDNSPIKDILDVDEFIANEFRVKDNRISGYKINIKDGFDKKRIANSYKGRKGIMIDGYDDAQLIDLKDLVFIESKKKLRRFQAALS
ncbi:MAG: hypothetical protein ACQEP1_03830 [Nanobdellota archaeon]